MIIEQLICEHLNAVLQVPVTTERAEDPQPSFVLVERTAGGVTNHISQATIAIQTYAPTMYQAALLLEDVIDAMHYLVEYDGIGAVRLASSYNFTDVAEKTYRYQAVYNVTYYREDIFNGDS